MSKCELQQNNAAAGCGCGAENEAAVTEERKELTIDFMYIDLEVCARCQGTESRLDQAIAEVSELLERTGYNVKVNSILVEKEQQAEMVQLVSSPTIRINGRDIQLATKESNCESCGTVAGTDVVCRVWVYQGKEYTEPPKELIMDALLRVVYGGADLQENREAEYVLPDNLKRFFAAKRKQASGTTADCCDSAASKCC